MFDIKTPIGAGLFLAAALRLCAAEPAPVTLSYQEVVAHLGGANPSSRVLALSEKAARQRAAQEGAYPNPQLSYARINSKEGDSTAGSDEWSASQEIDYSFRWLSRLSEAESTAASEAARLRAESIDFKREAVALYHSLQSLAMENAVVEAKRRSTAALFARVEQDRLVGQAKPGEWRRVQVASHLAEVEHLEIVSRLRNDSYKLAVLLGYPVGTRVVPKGALAFRERKIPAETIEKKALQNNPGIQQVRMELKAAKARGDLALKEAFPTLQAEGSRQQGDGMEEYRLGLSLTVPLWDRKDAARSSAGFEVQALEQKLKVLQAQASVEVKVAYGDYETAKRKVLALQQGLAEADELIRGSETYYREGRMPLAAFLDSLSAAYEIKHRFFLSVMDYEKSILTFAGLTGDESYFDFTGGEKP